MEMGEETAQALNRSKKPLYPHPPPIYFDCIFLAKPNLKH